MDTQVSGSVKDALWKHITAAACLSKEHKGLYSQGPKTLWQELSKLDLAPPQWLQIPELGSIHPTCS